MAELQKIRLMGTTQEMAERLNGNFTELEQRKVDQELKTGSNNEYKVLSDNNYSDAEKTKLSGISAEAKKVEASATNGNIKIDNVETVVYTLPADVLHTGDADPAGTAASAVSTHDSSGSAHGDIRTLVSTAQSTADTAMSIAEGRDKAIVFANYSSMVTALNAEATAGSKVGDNIYIRTVDVPDLWVSQILAEKFTYTYTTDGAIISAIGTDGYVDIGWYRLAQLESTKVDLSGYVPTSRKVNNKALSADITLDASDVGANKVEASQTNGNIKIDGVETNVYTLPAIDQVTEYDFAVDDVGWGSAVDGIYTLTLMSSKRPIVCYNSSSEIVMVTLGYNGTNITLKTDTKFAGKILAI